MQTPSPPLPVRAWKTGMRAASSAAASPTQPTWQMDQARCRPAAETAHPRVMEKYTRSR